MPEKRTHNIVTYTEDDAIVEAVQQRIGGTDYSAAIRFIIREFAVHADPEGKILRNLGSKTTPTPRKRTSKRTMNPDVISGVRRGMEAA
jgi:hypothetical protein